MAINVYVCNGCYLLWNPEDWLQLRTKHGIIGAFDGAEGEGWTKVIHVNLPFKLSDYEARYLQSKGVVKILRIPQLESLTSVTDLNLQAEYVKRFEKLQAEELENYKAKKRKEIEQNFGQILAGRRKKGLIDENCDKEAIVAQELAKASSFQYESALFDLGAYKAVHLITICTLHDGLGERFCGSRLVKIEDLKELSAVEPRATADGDRQGLSSTQLLLTYLDDPWAGGKHAEEYQMPELISGLERLKYQVYQDFHGAHGYYVTSGLKFGGDFIAYKGDPSEYHAEFVIMCEDSKRKYTELYLLSQCRLATILKKRLVIASYDETTDTVSYNQVIRPQ